MGRTAPVLIETVRVREGIAPLWHLHLRRLAGSCRALGVPFPRELQVPAGGPDRVHRLAVGLEGAEVTTRDVGPIAPLRLVLSPVPHEPYPHKTTDRGQFERARALARAAGADDAILCTSAGWVGEAGIWCLFWWAGDRVVGPPLELGILPGVSRLRIGELVDGGVQEERLHRDRIGSVALFAANAVRGIVPVVSVDGRPVPQDLRTAGLQDAFWT
jgi:branched-subunit amino acid aminotransferase/4-amino-4-deoxychorismate lyase